MNSKEYDEALRILGLVEEPPEPYEDTLMNFQVWGTVCQNPSFTAQTGELEGFVAAFAEREAGEKLTAQYFMRGTKIISLETATKRILLAKDQIQVFKK